MRGHALGIAVGILLLIFLPPVAIFVGALSAGFHRDTPPITFGLALSWTCRWAFYGVAALTVVGLLVVGLLIDAQMTIGFLLMFALAGAAITSGVDRSSGGGVL